MEAAHQMLEFPDQRTVALTGGFGAAVAMAVIGMQRYAGICQQLEHCSA